MEETTETPQTFRAFVIRNIEGGEEIDRVYVTGRSDREIDKIERGMAMRVDMDRFYFGLEDVAEGTKP